MDLFPIYFTQNHYFCFYFLILAFYFVPSLDNALLSELEFKHQVTTASGEGGRRRRGHESIEVPGCPEDRKRDGGRGGRGVVASRGWRADKGPVV